MIDVRIEADSLAPSGVRLTTFVLRYPRFIHSEFMTHRMLSRNAASSRAIPLKKTRREVLHSPVVPKAFSKNQAGMQAREDLSQAKQYLARIVWRTAGVAMVGAAWILEKLGVHKQHANRLLEPWLHITVVASATDWANFFALRCHPDAQPEFQELARQMYREYTKNIPQRLRDGEMHLPFVKDYERQRYDHNTLVKMSVARCARVSYLTHDGTSPDRRKDEALYEKLVGSHPMHASPAEHQAYALPFDDRHGNFRGWYQYRKTLDDECVLKYNGIDDGSTNL